LEKIDLIKIIKKISDRWYFHTSLMIIGGFSGLFFSYLNPPVFESSAVFSVTIDYTQTGVLTDIQEDQAMRGVGSVLSSDQVIMQTLSQLRSEFSQELNQSDFLNNSYLDREEFRWTLRYRDPDPEKAELVVRTWARSANLIIQEALTHSQSSSTLLSNLNDMKICLQKSPYSIGPGYCGFKDLESFLESVGKLSSQIQSEKEKSLGIFDALSVSLVNKGQVSPLAVRGQQNLLVLSGAMIGMVMSIIFTAVKVMKRS
jgi:hypothetical protein